MAVGDLSELQNGNYDQDEVAVGMVKFQCDCRLSHYASLLRRALDNAGFERVPIISTDFNDSKNSQSGVMLLGISAVVEAVWVFLMMDMLKDHVQKQLEKVACRHPLYEKALRPRDIYKEVEHIVPVTLSCGEGWLMAAEIAHYAKEGVTSFIILQPFGCLPNHVCGRGVIKALKDEYPGIQILPLDLDPDTSYANVENRLQMLIMNNRREDVE